MKKTEKKTEDNKDVVDNSVEKETSTEATKAPTGEQSEKSQAAKASPEVTEQPEEKSAPAPQPAAPVAAAPAAQNQGATWPGKLALVISLIALGGSGYLYWQGMQKQQSDAAAIGALQSDVKSTLESAKTQIADTKSVVNAQVNSVNQNLTMLQNQSAKEQKSIEELQQRLTASIQQVMAKQSNTRKDWLLAEVEYLLRLANQRILMENTSVGALALLKSADKILQETDDVSIYDVRKKLASDIAALEAVPTFDLEGSYLKLAALNEQVDNLRLIPITDKNKLPSLIEEITPESVSESWAQGLKESWAKAVDKLEKLVVIQHRDEKIEPLLSPEQTYYLQQNLHLMLEQAQLSLLQKEQAAFIRSLDKAEKWIATYFEEKDATTQALLRGINELKSLQISPELPNISGSLNALKSYLQQMTKLKEEGAA
ncbi:uroporphyrinogen-III C-methyltransferase [Neptunomonas marina]|uniref:Heme biosynthesis protein n=1 Tax=Neptunomonas marina TaxID=1815562 RepID=A0A437Q5H9_9GAMM|nr:uroporphyrinogen-III C-methyltransferase [Neptunomonas marina]RVU29760.1 heme biosynthesis protein [Neptunomonas marina]